MGYNLLRYGWLNNFVDAKNQSMWEDRVPWRGAPGKCPDFFSILFSTAMDKDNIIMDWQCGVGMFFISLFLILIFLFVSLFSICFIFHSSRILIFAQLVVLRDFVIACCSIQRHIIALELDIDIYKSILLPMCEYDQEHTSQHVAPL
jgi:hypothetical protein